MTSDKHTQTGKAYAVQLFRDDRLICTTLVASSLGTIEAVERFALEPFQFARCPFSGRNPYRVAARVA